MRGLFRASSFGNRLVSGSNALYITLSAFFIILLALSLQHTIRLNNEIERLHWQLALSQSLRLETARDRSVEHHQPGQTPTSNENSSNVQALLESFLSGFKDGDKQALRSKETENDVLTNPFPRFVVGIVLLLALAASVLIWTHLDSIESIAPDWIAQYLRNNDRHKPLSEIIAYEVDLWFSSQKYAKVLALSFFTVVLVFVGSLALFAVSNVPLPQAVWACFAGVGIDWTFAQDWITSSGISSFLGRFVAIAISLGGLLITALLLGIVSEIISGKVDEMKKGKSRVLETNHSLILGWSDEVVPIIKQLCLANMSIGGSPIVVLSEREKEEMEMVISTNGIDFMGSRVICRSGNPLLKHDLETVSVGSARSIIVLADQQSPDQSDARVLRIVLSLVAFHEAGNLKGYIVAELCDMDNEPLVKLVGGALVQTVVSHDIIGRLMVQCAQQPGLANVWEELMGFKGCEFYLQNWPQLTDKPFKEVLISFPAAIPIGVKLAKGGVLILNIDDDYILQEDDQLIVIAEDEDTYTPQGRPYIHPQKCPDWEVENLTQKILFCGWRRDMDDLIMVLDDFVPQGSELWLYSDIPILEREEMLVQGGLSPATDLKNLTLRYKDNALKGDLITRKKLAALRPASFSSILILADESAKGADIADADSRNLATLLLLRDLMADPCGSGLSSNSSQTLRHLRNASLCRGTPVIVSEILDARTRHLITELSISEFVMSNELVSMTLAMVAENADVNCILQELFSEQGSELYVYPSEKYFLSEKDDLTFFELMVRCRQHKEIAIGYRSALDRKTIINPLDKNDKKLNLYSVESVIVLAD